MSRRPWVYHPQSVRIPEDAGVKRNLVWKQKTDAKAPDAPARFRYDAETLFYDMFFASGVLTCIGPPFVNLGPPQSVLCDGRKLRFVNEAKSDSMLHARLRIHIPAEEQGRERLDLRFCFSDFEVSASCDMQRARPPSLPHRNLALVAIQKENPAQWLRDWLLWHYRAHGVQRAVIYDNGSRDFPELGGAFSDLAADLDVGLVRWPFPYGPRGAHSNRFAQTGVLNHFFMLFGGAFEWGLNLDIDEYLFVEGERTLAERLQQAQRRGQPALYLRERRFPREAVPEGRTPRFFHYCMRYREPYGEFSYGQTKYISQFRRSQVYGVHYVLFRSAFDFRRIGADLRHILKFRIFRSKASGGWPLSRCLQYVFRYRFPARFAKYGQANCCYFHYRGLNTGWKTVGEKSGPYPGVGPDVSEIPPEFLIEDRRAAELADELGFRVAEEERGDASEAPPAGPAADA